MIHASYFFLIINFHTCMCAQYMHVNWPVDVCDMVEDSYKQTMLNPPAIELLYKLLVQRAGNTTIILQQLVENLSLLKFANRGFYQFQFFFSFVILLQDSELEKGVLGSQDVWGEPVERCMLCFKDFPLSVLVEHSWKCTGDLLGSAKRFKSFLPSVHDVSKSLIIKFSETPP